MNPAGATTGDPGARRPAATDRGPTAAGVPAPRRSRADSPGHAGDLPRSPDRPRPPGPFPAYLAFIRAGFLRHLAYRQATVAATFTNSVFGFLRCYVLLAAASGALGSGTGRGAAAGYSPQQLATFVWASQGMLGVVLLWGSGELAGRIRSGEVAADLLRPVDPVWQYLATDLGRAGHAALTRFVVPMTVGALAFDLYAPRRPGTYPMFVLAVLLATLVCAGCRFLVEACAYWLLDARGPRVAWGLIATGLGGLVFPLWFLPDWLSVGLVVATPMPSIIELPLDVLAERWSVAGQCGALAVQTVWVVLLLAACRLVQRRAERHLVVQGG